ncbi:MAG: hypothetical protein AB7I19_09400 [Planctomycetota bacterium]
MSYEFYRVLHIAGLAALFLGLGGMLAGQRKSFGMLHGLGLVLLLVSGFGAQAKASLGFPGWMIAMIGIWVVLAVMPVVAKRQVLPTPLVVLASLALGVATGWLAFYKPF